jgi:SAM-dependent methyltransferase
VVAGAGRRGFRDAAVAAGALVFGAALAVALWWRRNPSACPYSQRFWVEAPHPVVTRARLLEALDPQPGERLLEVGPGTGYYSLTVAERLGPGGRLELLDLQQEMLDHTLARAARAGVDNVSGVRADARRIPLADASLDGAFLVLVLGEVPDQPAALAELARVVRPGGRVVVGEMALDPHYVRYGTLLERAAAAGLELERRVGGALGYFARLRVAHRGELCGGPDRG